MLFKKHERYSYPWAKSPKNQSVGVYFDNMALYLGCRINKNALLQTVFFWFFSPLGSTSIGLFLIIFVLFVRY